MGQVYKDRDENTKNLQWSCTQLMNLKNKQQWAKPRLEQKVPKKTKIGNRMIT
jgi:hypothetical protein